MSKKSKQLDSREEVVSMFLGLAVVVVVALILINFIQRRKGTVDIPGITNNNQTEQVEKTEESRAEYTVQRNDSLWKIAQKVYGDGYKWTVIAKENNLENPDQLEIGQKLVTPELENIEETSESKTEVPEEYTVLQNDNLWKIAVTYFNDGYQWTKIWQLNSKTIRDPNLLEIGMKLKLR